MKDDLIYALNKDFLFNYIFKINCSAIFAYVLDVIGIQRIKMASEFSIHVFDVYEFYHISIPDRCRKLFNYNINSIIKSDNLYLELKRLCEIEFPIESIWNLSFEL